MSEFHSKSRVLIQNGRWQVPVEERPENWRSILEEGETGAAPSGSASDAAVLDAAVAATEDRLPVAGAPAVACSVTWCNQLVESFKFTSEDGEYTIGLCQTHSEMSSLFCCDEKSPKWIAEKFGCTQAEVLEAVRLEMVGLWLEHDVERSGR